MKTSYEWDLETVELLTAECVPKWSKTYPETNWQVGDKGDVFDHDHSDKLSGFCGEDITNAINQEVTDNKKVDLVLVCDDHAGRSWAYVVDGQLPSHFTCAYGDKTKRVPKRFHVELSKKID